jgi:hypothetical protein
MNQKYFIFPFATAGDLTEIPNPTQGSGVVSYQQGFGSLYSEDPLTVGTALEIDRAMFNAILYDLTTNLQNYQQNGSPEWIDTTDNGGAAFSYRIGSMVRHSSSGNAPFTPYLAIADNVTAVPTEGTNWSQVATYKIVNTEVARAEAAETTLQTNINTEVARSEAAETNLGNLINAETSRAESAEASLYPGRYTGLFANGTPTGGGVYTVPAGINYIRIRLWGGGGGGSYCNNYSPTVSASNVSGGGGGGGGYGELEYSVTPGQTIGYIIGAGGGSAANGGDSQINNPGNANMVCGGGSKSTFTSVGVSPGGFGGTVSGANLSFGGSDGSDGQGEQFVFAGNGGASGSGGGGGRAGGEGGKPATGYGGGGGGAYSPNVDSVTYPGGAGQGGLLVIYQYTGV